MSKAPLCQSDHMHSDSNVASHLHAPHDPPNVLCCAPQALCPASPAHAQGRRLRPSTTPLPGIFPLCPIARFMNVFADLFAAPTRSRGPTIGGRAAPAPRTGGRRWTVRSLLSALHPTFISVSVLLDLLKNTRHRLGLLPLPSFSPALACALLGSDGLARSLLSAEVGVRLR